MRYVISDIHGECRAQRDMTTDLDGFALRAHVYAGDKFFGSLDATETAEIFNYVCNHAFFDPECE